MTPQAWLARFREENIGHSARMRADALWPHVRQPGFVQHWLRASVADMAHDPAILPTGHGTPWLRSLVLFDDGELHLSLAMIEGRAWHAARQLEAQETLEFADGWTRLCFLRAEQVEVQRFHRDPARPDRAYPQGYQQVRVGQEFALDNASELLRFSAIGGECLYLRLLVRNPDQRHVTEHDARTGALLRIRQAQSHEGRLQMTLSLLRSLGRADAMDLIAQKIAEWPPELRWHTVREALALDSRRGFALLDTISRSDPDPKLRALALDTRVRLLLAHPELGPER